MFRAAKKKKKLKRPRLVVSRDDEEESGDDINDRPNIVDTAKQKKAAKRKNKVGNKRKTSKSAALSFDVEEDEDGGVRSRKAKRYKRMGFGASAMNHHDDCEEGVDHDDHKSKEASRHDEDDGGAYNKAALEKLKSEQQYKPKKVVVEETSPTVTTPSVQAASGEESFISLHTSTVLSGDDAIKLDHDISQNEEDSQRQDPSKSTSVGVKEMIQQEDIPSDWEQEVTRRAGLASGVDSTSTSTTRRSPPAATATSSIAALRNQVESSLEHLQIQQADLEQTLKRRTVEANHVRDEWKRQEKEVKDAGNALEFYQHLRLQLVSWVGALRDLQKKVTPVQEAIRHLEKQHSERWTELENDVVHDLKKANLLEKVVGRQPPVDIETETVVDEFGRDVKSQQAMERDKRKRQRAQLRRERSLFGDMNADILVSRSEREELDERRKALEEALVLAKSEVEENYTSIVNLTRVFESWFKDYPEEYQQCYAGMSLSDLASVLIQIDLCSVHHPLHWNPDSGGFPWAPLLRDLSHNGPMEESPIYRLVDKVLVPAVEYVLDDNAYNLASKEESVSLSGFLSELSKLLPSSNILIEKLQSRVITYIRESLQSIAVPILSSIPELVPDVLEEAVEYASSGQLRRIQAAVTNIIHFWYPLLGDKMAETVLDFISSQFLFLLSAVRAQGKPNDQRCKEAFGEVWSQLTKTKWLNDSGNFLVTAPIRAAAAVYLSQS